MGDITVLTVWPGSHPQVWGIGWWVAGLQCHHVPSPSLGLLRVSLAELLQIPLDTAAQPYLNATGTRLLIPLHTLSRGPGTAHSACSHVSHQGSQWARAGPGWERPRHGHHCDRCFVPSGAGESGKSTIVKQMK